MAIYQIMRGCGGLVAGFGPGITLRLALLGVLVVGLLRLLGACEALVRGLYTVFSHPYCQPIKGNLEM